jgi:nucleoside-diphosphate-sugar epimerase
MSQDYRDFYRGRRVLITGGLGFIGSNLARQLVDLGADVLLVDSISRASKIGSASTSRTCRGVCNVGGNEPVTHRDLVTLLIDRSGRGSLRFVEWPDDKRRIDIGSFYSDWSKFCRATGWRPTVTLREGLTRTLAYYRDNLDEYLDEPDSSRPS